MMEQFEERFEELFLETTKRVFFAKDGVRFLIDNYLLHRLFVVSEEGVYGRSVIRPEYAAVFDRVLNSPGTWIRVVAHFPFSSLSVVWRGEEIPTTGSIDHHRLERVVFGPCQESFPDTILLSPSTNE